ncbi:hypothetical protein D3C83_252960 [compost metagenome]
MQQPGHADRLRLRGGQADIQRERAAEIAHALRMPAGVAVLRFQGQRERADHVLRLFEVGVVLADAQQ